MSTDSQWPCGKFIVILPHFDRVIQCTFLLVNFEREHAVHGSAADTWLNFNMFKFDVQKSARKRRLRQTLSLVYIQTAHKLIAPEPATSNRE